MPMFDALWLDEHRRLQDEEQLEALELLTELMLA